MTTVCINFSSSEPRPSGLPRFGCRQYGLGRNMAVRKPVSVIVGTPEGEIKLELNPNDSIARVQEQVSTHLLNLKPQRSRDGDIPQHIVYQGVRLDDRLLLRELSWTGNRLNLDCTNAGAQELSPPTAIHVEHGQPQVPICRVTVCLSDLSRCSNYPQSTDDVLSTNSLRKTGQLIRSMSKHQTGS